MSNAAETLPLTMAGWYISYMNYHATGEGVTSYLAVAGQAELAERVLRERIPEFFHQFLVTTSIDAEMDSDAKQMIKWLPEPAKEILRKIPCGAGHYFTELRYNLS